MNMVVLVLVGLLAGCAGTSVMSVPPGGLHDGEASKAPTYAFVNGRWFDGQGFQATTWY